MPVLAVAVGATVLAPLVLTEGHDHGVAPVRLSAAADGAPPTRPIGRTRPRFLTTSYRAPVALIRPGDGGTLRIPSLGIEAPIDAVGLDGTTMAVPDDPHRVGWLASSAEPGDVTGASVLAGHVSDPADRPGALHALKRVRLGASIFWTGEDGRRRRFRVRVIRRYRRADGLPAATFATDGPHVLTLITCTERVATPGGGFHYRSNLVVTAVR